MGTDSFRLLDQVLEACGYSRKDADDAGTFGWGYAELFDGDMQLMQAVPFVNLITDTGDLYYAKRNRPIQSSTVAVTAITNATTAVCTTTGAHHFAVGDVVTLAGITPTLYNGNWAITAVGTNAAEDGSTTFSIYVGTALGALTVAGTAVSAAIGKATVMRLGTGSTAVAKSGAGAAIVTYTGTSVTGSKAFDATFPAFVNLGAGLGCQTQYKTTWNAGEATITGLNEVVIGVDNANTNGADLAGTAAFTISRALLSPVVNKGASDTLAVTWNHKFLG